jgi:tyrosine-protein phosphatase YwqE
MAEKLIEAGMIEFLGSDLHNQQSLALLEKTLTQPALEKVMISGKLLNHLI